ncbi:protein NATD1 [Hyposmocoma kahamanoa]|uniref:protein NATD1 n=1 Tax=Hyposmocoma kahamanoa TaxID=1477025 RepID=UPI000E6DA550|nr:protein NATD1 [Hyposmocoma kahamanoa]
MITRSGLRAFTSVVNRVIHNVAKQQFVVTCPSGEDAVLRYSKDDSTNITFLHTNVPETCQGQGVGKKLAEAAFRYAYEQHLTVVVKCHYLANFYKKNHEKFHNLQVLISLD